MHRLAGGCLLIQDKELAGGLCGHPVHVICIVMAACFTLFYYGSLDSVSGSSIFLTPRFKKKGVESIILCRASGWINV